MPVTANFSQYVCDRCGANAYIQDSDNAQKSKWTQIQRVTSDNVSTSRELCESCAREYKKLAASQDGTFNRFMAGGDVE